MKKSLVFSPLFLACLGFLAFLRTSGAESVKAVQVVALIGIGMCLGVGLANLRLLLSEKSR